MSSGWTIARFRPTSAGPSRGPPPALMFRWDDSRRRQRERSLESGCINLRARAIYGTLCFQLERRGASMPTTNTNLDSFDDRGPLLRWLVFTGLWFFAFVLLWRFGLVRQMVASDRTYLSSIIGLLYVAASMHCLWRTIVISREGDAARRGGALIAAGSGGLNLDGDAIVVEGAGQLPPGLV